ncbi:MAG: endonuclease/exonuclease/phosphatase family protein [Alphaproteobacteria bacterium]
MSMLRLLTFNIRGGYDLRGQRDLRRVHALMDEYDVDIGVFQEMETRPSNGGTADDIDLLAGPERPYHLPGPTLKEGLGWYGNLLVSRYPIGRAIVHDLETQKTRPVSEPRNAVDALIKTPHGPVRVIGTHLSLSSVVRWWELNNLMKLADQVDVKNHETEKPPVFFMGDINEWRWPSKLLQHLDEIMTPLPCGKTFPSFFLLFRLDRAWSDGPGVKASARVLKGRNICRLSDHLPVLVEVSDLG